MKTVLLLLRYGTSAAHETQPLQSWKSAILAGIHTRSHQKYGDLVWTLALLIGNTDSISLYRLYSLLLRTRLRQPLVPTLPSQSKSVDSEKAKMETDAATIPLVGRHHQPTPRRSLMLRLPAHVSCESVPSKSWMRWLRAGAANNALNLSQRLATRQMWNSCMMFKQLGSCRYENPTVRGTRMERVPSHLQKILPRRQ